MSWIELPVFLHVPSMTYSFMEIRYKKEHLFFLMETLFCLRHHGNDPHGNYSLISRYNEENVGCWCDRLN